MTDPSPPRLPKNSAKSSSARTPVVALRLSPRIEVRRRARSSVGVPCRIRSTSRASLSFARAEPRLSWILNILATRSAPGPATFARMTRGSTAGSSEAISCSARSTRTPSSPSTLRAALTLCPCSRAARRPEPGLTLVGTNTSTWTSISRNVEVRRRVFQTPIALLEP